MNPKTIEYVKNMTKNITSINIDLPIHKDHLSFYKKKADELGIGVEQYLKDILMILLLQENNRSKWPLLFGNLIIKTFFYYFINFFNEILLIWIVDFI